ncbi:uncharacterized protein L201_006371 [Kwoniella dendrophila CBS 6074]|uniref:Transcription elongation factor Eaf N-terminal domain-containing protein n=1 Tax=Kwoniella dendrophila CBS 6074 TaxID=1295534 RepID=A0AAX4K3N7_9TREE
MSESSTTTVHDTATKMNVLKDDIEFDSQEAQGYYMMITDITDDPDRLFDEEDTEHSISLYWREPNSGKLSGGTFDRVGNTTSFTFSQDSEDDRKQVKYRGSVKSLVERMSNVEPYNNLTKPEVFELPSSTSTNTPRKLIKVQMQETCHSLAKQRESAVKSEENLARWQRKREWQKSVAEADTRYHAQQAAAESDSNKSGSGIGTRNQPEPSFTGSVKRFFGM